MKIVPDILVGGNDGVLGGLGAMLMRNLAQNTDGQPDAGGSPNGNGTARKELEAEAEPEPEESEPVPEPEPTA